MRSNNVTSDDAYNWAIGVVNINGREEGRSE